MKKRTKMMLSVLLALCMLWTSTPVAALTTEAVSTASTGTITLDKDIVNLAPNGGATVTATTDLTSYSITWSSSDTSIATVEKSGDTTCFITGVKSGVVTVTAKLSNGATDTCTVYVSITNGVYFIKYSSLYLSVDGGMIEGSTLTLQAKKSGGPAQLRQLWKIEHAGQHYYTIRSVYRPDLALNVTDGVVDMAALSTSLSSSDSPAARKWKISRVSSSYVLQHRGYTSRTMQPADTTIDSGTDVIAGANSTTQYTWSLEWASVSNQVLLINTEVGLPATNAVRYVAQKETITLADMDFIAVFVSQSTNYQNIKWTSSDTSVAVVDNTTGAVTGASQGQCTITASRTYGSNTYSASYTINVTAPETDTSVFDDAVTIRLGNSASVDIVVAGQSKYFKFVPDTTGSYIIQSSDSSGNPQVWVYDASYSQIGSDNNSGGNLNFRLSITLTANRTYYIAAGHSATKTGAYRVTVLKEAALENRFYRVQNISSLLYLDVCGPAEQQFVHQWSYHTDPQSAWLIQKESDTGYYTIRSQYGDNLYVGIASTNTGENNIKLYSDISDATRWRIYVTYLGRYILEPKTAMGKVLYAPDSNEGTKMQLAWLGSGNNGKWSIQVYAYTGKTFSAFDVGDSETDEVALVETFFEAAGYTNIGTYKNTEDIISGQLIKDVSRYSDIVYINGHGGKKANLYIQNADGDLIEYLCAESSVDIGYSKPKVEIGAQYTVPFTTTESCWNQRTKWVILPQCDQFNVGAEGDGEFFNGDNSAEVWAQTMLGDGERLHGFLGYYNGAPPDEQHTSRLTEFLQNTASMTIIDAWKEAHPSGLFVPDTNWAVMYHADNADDRVDSFTANTPTGEEPVIYLERFELPSAVTNSTSTLSVTENAYPLLVDSLDTNSAATLCTELQSKLTMDDDCSLEVDDNNRIIYHNRNNHTGEAQLGMELSDDQAVQAALQELKELDLSPDGEYRASVSYVRRYRMNTNSDQPENGETIEYTVRFYRTYNGVNLLSDQEDGIVVSFNKYGLTELKHHWRDLQIVATEQPISYAVSEEQARSISQTTDNTITGDTATIDNAEQIVKVAYVQIEDEVKCVWVCSPDGSYGDSVLIDVNTGEQVDLG